MASSRQLKGYAGNGQWLLKRPRSPLGLISKDTCYCVSEKKHLFCLPNAHKVRTYVVQGDRFKKPKVNFRK